MSDFASKSYSLPSLSFPQPTTYIKNKTVNVPMMQPRMIVSFRLLDWIRPRRVFMPGSVSGTEEEAEDEISSSRASKVCERTRVNFELTQGRSHPRVDVL